MPVISGIKPPIAFKRDVLPEPLSPTMNIKPVLGKLYDIDFKILIFPILKLTLFRAIE